MDDDDNDNDIDDNDNDNDIDDNDNDDDDNSSQMKEADKALTGMEKWCGLFVCPWNKSVQDHHHNHRFQDHHNRFLHHHHYQSPNHDHAAAGKPHCRTQTPENGRSRGIRQRFLSLQTNLG